MKSFITDIILSSTAKNLEDFDNGFIRYIAYHNVYITITEMKTKGVTTILKYGVVFSEKSVKISMK